MSRSSAQLSRVALRLAQISARGGVGSSVSKDLEFKNESGIVLYDSDDEDNVRITGPNECDNYTIVLPEEPGNMGEFLRVDDVNTDDPDRPQVLLEFRQVANQGLNTDDPATFDTVTTSTVFPNNISMGSYFEVFSAGSTLLRNNRGDTRLLLVANPDDLNNTGRHALVDRSAALLQTSGAASTITLDSGLICQNGFVYVKHAGCTIQLPALSLSIDTGYNAVVSQGAGPPAVNAHFTVRICADGANSFTIGNGNSPSGYTFINRSLPYSSPTVFSVVTLHFIKRNNSPTAYDVIIQAS